MTDAGDDEADELLVLRGRELAARDRLGRAGDVVARLNDCIDESYALHVLIA